MPVGWVERALARRNPSMGIAALNPSYKADGTRVPARALPPHARTGRAGIARPKPKPSPHRTRHGDQAQPGRPFALPAASQTAGQTRLGLVQGFRQGAEAVERAGETDGAARPAAGGGRAAAG